MFCETNHDQSVLVQVDCRSDYSHVLDSNASIGTPSCCDVPDTMYCILNILQI